MQCLIEIFAQGNNVTALSHRYAQAHCLKAHVAHFAEWRINVAAFDGGDITNFQHAPIGTKREIANRFNAIQCTRGTHKYFIGRGFKCATGSDGVLCLHGGDDGCAVDAQRGELDIGKLDINFFFLLANNVHFGNIRHAQ